MLTTIFTDINFFKIDKLYVILETSSFVVLLLKNICIIKKLDNKNVFAYQKSKTLLLPYLLDYNYLMPIWFLTKA